mmetsp:Transcript_7849/g.33016  ORF Transcript_7849/g.33016 Transcript_7849/m.33016 type:complete len:216 (-) Transcript_7849:756-1403(-)
MEESNAIHRQCGCEWWLDRLHDVGEVRDNVGAVPVDRDRHMLAGEEGESVVLVLDALHEGLHELAAGTESKAAADPNARSSEDDVGESEQGIHDQNGAVAHLEVLNHSNEMSDYSTARQPGAMVEGVGHHGLGSHLVRTMHSHCHHVDAHAVGLWLPRDVELPAMTVARKGAHRLVCGNDRPHTTEPRDRMHQRGREDAEGLMGSIVVHAVTKSL